jgi:hypothetical protein
MRRETQAQRSQKRGRAFERLVGGRVEDGGHGTRRSVEPQPAGCYGPARRAASSVSRLSRSALAPSQTKTPPL